MCLELFARSRGAHVLQFLLRFRNTVTKPFKCIFHVCFNCLPDIGLQDDAIDPKCLLGQSLLCLLKMGLDGCKTGFEMIGGRAFSVVS